MTVTVPQVHSYAFSNAGFHPISIHSSKSHGAPYDIPVLLHNANASKLILRDVFGFDSLMWNFIGLLCYHPNCYFY